MRPPRCKIGTLVPICRRCSDGISRRLLSSGGRDTRQESASPLLLLRRRRRPVGSPSATVSRVYESGSRVRWVVLPGSKQEQERQQGQQGQQEQQQQQHNRARRTTDCNRPPGLPADASSLLSAVAARRPARSLSRYLSALLALSKPRLTVLVVLTAMAPYALYPVPAILVASSHAAATPSLSPLTLLFLGTGTALCSASANTLNMLYEPDTDARMSRTRARPLVRRLLGTHAAVLFAVATLVSGTAALYAGVNPTVATLGLVNVVLYAAVYTPLKRVSAANTWVGALVGAVPPLMGWAAAAGESTAPGAGPRDLLLAPDGSSVGGWLLAALLFAWQFPHFMALSWGVRAEYRAAGLRMLAWTDPPRNARVALRYSLALVPLCAGLCAAGVTEWSFAATSLPVNVWLAGEAVRFWRTGGDVVSARRLFWASVWHLPVVMVLALIQKKGMCARLWRGVVGEGGGEWEEEEEDADGGVMEPLPAVPDGTEVEG